MSSLRNIELKFVVKLQHVGTERVKRKYAAPPRPALNRIPQTFIIIIIIIIISNHTPARGAKGEGIGEGNKDRHPIHTTNKKVHV